MYRIESILVAPSLVPFGSIGCVEKVLYDELDLYRFINNSNLNNTCSLINLYPNSNRLIKMELVNFTHKGVGEVDNLNIIFLSIGFVTLLISLFLLILKFSNGTYKISPGIISLSLIGFISLSVGIVLMVPDIKDKVISVATKEEEVLTLTEESNSEGEAVNDGDLAAGIDETEPQKIARELVEQEMSIQVGLKSWEITENVMTSDQYVYNIADYDKPIGDMRKVWIEGFVKATAAEDGSTGSIGYNLELYQMKGDHKWYIGEHWGVLANLEVTEEPDVEEDERFFSNSEDIIIDQETGGLLSHNVPDYGETFEEANPTKVFTEKDLNGAWHWRDLDDIYMIFRDDFTYSYFEKNAGFLSEGTYSVTQLDDNFEVDVDYNNELTDSNMVIKLINKNQLMGKENGYRWDALRVSIEEAEGTLKSIMEGKK